MKLQASLQSALRWKWHTHSCCPFAAATLQAMDNLLCQCLLPFCLCSFCALDCFIDCCCAPAPATGGAALCQAADGSVAVADLGGSIITGIDGNPLAVLARQLDIPMHDINSNDVPLYLRDGSQLPQAVDMQVRQAARAHSGAHALFECRPVIAPCSFFLL